MLEKFGVRIIYRKIQYLVHVCVEQEENIVLEASKYHMEFKFLLGV
jgi:hypothetical protein